MYCNNSTGAKADGAAQYKTNTSDNNATSSGQSLTYIPLEFSWLRLYRQTFCGSVWVYAGVQRMDLKSHEMLARYCLYKPVYLLSRDTSSLNTTTNLKYLWKRMYGALGVTLVGNYGVIKGREDPEDMINPSDRLCPCE